MLKFATLLVLSIAFALATVTTLQAQTQLERPTPNKVATVAGAQSGKVTAELQRQEKFLLDIAARYDEVSTYDLIPLLRYPHLWSALRENRSRVAGPNAALTASQSRQFKKAYDLLEEQTLLSFLDQQLNMLTETLELDEAQQEVTLKFLTMDLSNKRLLLVMSVNPQDFRNRLDKISDATEAHILSVLSPEQRKTFDRQQMFNRNRMVG